MGSSKQASPMVPLLLSGHYTGGGITLGSIALCCLNCITRQENVISVRDFLPACYLHAGSEKK